MNKTLRMAVVTAIAVLGIIMAYRILFIRTVNYNIGGINMPAKYNVLTGKADPVLDLNAVSGKNAAADLNKANIGMDTNDITAARFRWALFEAWAKSRKQYKGWESDPEIFKKANEEFKSKIQASVKVIK